MKLTLMKFGASWCAGCRALDRAGTLEKFSARHPEVKVSIHDDTENGSQRWSDLADEHGVKSIPTLVWKYGDEILFKTDDVSARGIEAQLERAMKKAGL